MNGDTHDTQREETWGSFMASVEKQASEISVIQVDDENPWTAQAAGQLSDSLAGVCLFDLGENGAPDLEGFLALATPWLDQKADAFIFGIRLRVSDICDPETAVSGLRHLCDHGLRLVHWLADGKTIPRPLFWQASKMGIWNHLSGPDLFSDRDPSGPGAWIANNPNIVHSFESTGDALSGDSLLPERPVVPRALCSYGKLPDIPGVPVWQVLGNPERILAALVRTKAKPLQRLRVDLDREMLFSLGSRLEYHFKTPQEFNPQTMDEIVAMVDAGGSVDITHVRANLVKAYLIAYVTENGVIAGNSSLKHPRQVFIQRLNQITGLDFTRFVERGYTSVRPEYRAMGIGAKLLEGLTCRATDVKVFSLISEDNLATQKIALRNNTRKIAVYYSDKVGKQMGVWMPEQMIDSSWELDL